MLKHFFWIFLLLIVCLRVSYSQPTYQKGDFVTLVERVSSEPILYEYSRGLEIEGLWVYLPLFPEIGYGDYIEIEGIVEDGKIKDAKLVSFQKSKSFLFPLRSKILKLYKESLPIDHAGLIGGFVLGSKENITRDLWENLKKTGTAHVVVASGMNVTLVASFLVSFLIIFVPRSKAIIFALLGIWMYAVLAGFDAPIVRAAIMGSITFVAQALGRVRLAFRSLFLSAFLMLIIWPKWANDVGFYLSFAATLSLMVFEKPIRERISYIPKYFREDVSTSLAAQIGVSPILYYVFGYINIWSIFFNLLVLWTVVPATIIGAIAGLMGLVFPELGRFVLYFSYPFTWWFLKVVNI